MRYDDEERLTCSNPGQVLRILWKTCACCSDAQNSCKCCNKENIIAIIVRINIIHIIALVHRSSAIIVSFNFDSPDKMDFELFFTKTFNLDSPDKMDVSCHRFLLIILKVWGKRAFQLKLHKVFSLYLHHFDHLHNLHHFYHHHNLHHFDHNLYFFPPHHNLYNLLSFSSHVHSHQGWFRAFF